VSRSARGGRDKVHRPDRNAAGDAPRARSPGQRRPGPDAVRDGLFTCTTCQACFKVCPKKIEIPGKAIEKLRAHANRKGLTLPRHLEVAALVRETGRSVPRTSESFLEKVGDVIEPAGPVRATVGLFIGCVYNLRQQQSALDAMEVLRRNGIRVIIRRSRSAAAHPSSAPGSSTT